MGNMATAKAGIGDRVTGGFWYRGVKVYGREDGPKFLVRLYWPMSDPRPVRRWWS